MALIIMVSFVMLGGLLGFQLYNFLVEEKKENLTKTCENIVLRTAQRIEQENSWAIINREAIEQQYKVTLLNFAQDSGSLIYVTLPTGKVSYYSDGLVVQSGSSVTVQPISPETIGGIVEQRGISVISRLDGYYQTAMFNIAIPLFTQQGEVICVVIVSSHLRNLASMFYDIVGKFLLTVSFIITLAFIIAWMIANSMTRPLKQMRDAARSFERGNFDVRLRVHGEDEIAEVAEAFNSMAMSLAKLESMRSDFVANVSHEMKTPMTTIAGFIDGILDGTIPKERQHKYLEIISEEIRRLSRLVQRTLFVSRLQSGIMQLHPAPMDITKPIGHVIIGFERKIDEKRLLVNVEFDQPSVYVYADADAVNQVIYNLIDNAVKYSDEGGRIDIVVSSRGSHVNIRIGNTGPGIAEEDIPFVFDRFFKADRSRSIHASSYGLGLYIAKSIINGHGEDLRVRSENGYTEFSFNLKTTDKA